MYWILQEEAHKIYFSRGMVFPSPLGVLGHQEGQDRVVGLNRQQEIYGYGYSNVYWILHYSLYTLKLDITSIILKKLHL